MKQLLLNIEIATRVLLRQIESEIVQLNSRKLQNKDLFSGINNKHRAGEFENCTQSLI